MLAILLLSFLIPHIFFLLSEEGRVSGLDRDVYGKHSRPESDIANYLLLNKNSHNISIRDGDSR